MSLVSLDTFIVVRVGDRCELVDITGCQWCGQGQFICALCAAKADKARAALAKAGGAA